MPAPYTPNATDPTRPLNSDLAYLIAAEMRTLKSYMQQQLALMSGTIPVTFRNRLLNSSFACHQRGNSVTSDANSPKNIFVADAWEHSFLTWYPGVTMSRVDLGTAGPDGHRYSARVSVSSSPIISPDEYTGLQTYIPITRLLDASWGTANAKAITLSFWVKAASAGNYSLSLSNFAGGIKYATNYSVSAANTWEKKVVTIPGPTAGGYFNVLSDVLYIFFNAGSGSNQQTSSGNTWLTSGGKKAVTGSVQAIASTGTPIEWCGIQFEVAATATDFEFIPWSVNELMCKSRFEIITLDYYGDARVAGTNNQSVILKPTSVFAINPASHPTVEVWTAGTRTNITSVAVTYSAPTGDNSGVIVWRPTNTAIGAFSTENEKIAITHSYI